MFYAASEIVFWILLSAIIGGGIGYGLCQAKSVQLGKRLSESRADAPMERELAIAWDTIEDLNRRLQVAHETIRGGVGETAPAIEPDPLPLSEPNSSAADDSDAMLEDANSDGEEPEDDTPDDDAPDEEATAPCDESELASPLVHTVERLVPAAELEEDGDEASDAAVGTRLSDRVASASIGNQVEVIKTVEF